jgi:hypothetical protein
MSKFPSFRRAVLSGCVFGLMASVLPLASHAGSPRVNSVYPSGGQRGTEVEVTFAANNVKDGRDLLFNDPGFTVSEVKFDKNRLTAKIKIGAEVPLGEHLYRVVTSSGIGDLRTFYVTPFPMVEEIEDKKDPDKAQPVALGTTVYGRTQAEDQDRYLVEAKKGQRITAEVIGARLQTQNVYDSLVRISKENGEILTEVDDTAFGRQDPVASIIAPEDGKYIVTIKDSTNSGLGECHYLMHLGSYLQPLTVYPAGGPVGEEVKLTLLGDASGPIETKVKLPAKPDEQFELFTNKDQPAPMPNTLRVVNFPNALEAEPNDDTQHATAAAPQLPIALNGIIEKKGDVDFFKITAKKGQTYEVNVFARTLRSPLDSVLAIYNDKGGRLVLNDDDGVLDSHVRWSPPADGEYYVSVTDQLGRGGDLFTYRVEIKAMEPKLALYLPEMTINSSQDRRAVPVPKGNRYATLLRLKRGDIAGDVQIEPKDLPAGVTISAGKFDKSVDTIPVVFEAAADAAPVAKHFSVVGKLTEPPKDVPPVRSTIEHKVEIVENGNQRPYYGVTEDKLPIAVEDPAPVKITLAQPKVPILQNGAMPLKVKVERVGDFKGQVTLSLLYAPPGIGAAGTTQVKENETEGQVIISANAGAAAQKWKICVVATADPGTGPVWTSSQLVDLEVAPPFLVGAIQRTFVDQSDTGSVTVKLDQKVPFEGKAKIALQGLPSGVTSEEKEITKDDTVVKFDIKADAKSQPGQHRQLFCQFKLAKEGEEMMSNFAQGGVLRVDKATVAKNEEKK